MPTQFQNLRFHATDLNEKKFTSSPLTAPLLRGAATSTSVPDYNNPEAAARYYLSRFFEADERPNVRGLVSQRNPEVVPDLQHLSTLEQLTTGTRLVRFQQTQSHIPIFGSLAIVELDKKQGLVSLNADVAEVEGVPAIAGISQQDAIEAVASKTKVNAANLAKIDPPELCYYFWDQDEKWHLTWHLKKVPAAPPDFLREVSAKPTQDHGLGKSPRTLSPVLNYFVDAHSGKILFYYSAQPMFAVVPTKCKGEDEYNKSCEFFGKQLNPNGFEMRDPFHSITTYDLGFKNFDTEPLPPNPVQNMKADWQSTNKAAVSAHVNATLVCEFYKSLMFRDGIDDKGMELISIVGCTYSQDKSYPYPEEWHNAVWYKNRMWYGQNREANGAIRSYSRFLDIIAHELTHGVTEYTSNLIYSAQSGALNESFSDIFGVIINNWSSRQQKPDMWKSVAGWNWEIGSGLGQNGSPLRDMSDPTRTSDPDHMKDYLHTLADDGGVHTNSNIHNKAAYKILMTKDANLDFLFPPKEVAILYYLCLIRLNQTADFSKTLQVLLDVAKTFYAGNTAERQEKTAAITKAYNLVGIS